MFFDTHLHLDLLADRTKKTIAQLLAECQLAGVSQCLTLGTTKKDFYSLAKIQSPQVKIALGLHPLWIDEHQEEDLILLEKTLSQQCCVAVGEIGLDRGINALSEENLWQKQQYFFIEQLKLAEKLHLPVVIHSRKTHMILLQLLKKHPVSRGGVIHGFSGSLEEAKQFIRLGMKIGVGGVITFERAKKTRHAIEKLPLEHLVLETDSPDMPLAGKLGEVNVPQNIIQIFETLCDLKKIPHLERPTCAEQLFQQSNALFSLP